METPGHRQPGTGTRMSIISVLSRLFRKQPGKPCLHCNGTGRVQTYFRLVRTDGKTEGKNPPPGRRPTPPPPPKPSSLQQHPNRRLEHHWCQRCEHQNCPHHVDHLIKELQKFQEKAKNVPVYLR